MRQAELDPRLIDILVCPVTKGSLSYDRERNELVSKSAQLAYPIRDGIPVMLVSEARSLVETKPPTQPSPGTNDT